MLIEDVLPEHYGQLLSVWGNSVWATHDFIRRADIREFKPMILDPGFPSVTLRCTRSEQGEITGVVEVSDNKVEMLFIDDNHRGNGFGRELLHCAIDELGADKLDVNVQNPQAVGFYQHQGFEIISRSPLDDMGNPFPILHMQR